MAKPSTANRVRQLRAAVERLSRADQDGPVAEGRGGGDRQAQDRVVQGRAAPGGKAAPDRAQDRPARGGAALDRAEGRVAQGRAVPGGKVAPDRAQDRAPRDGVAHDRVEDGRMLLRRLVGQLRAAVPSHGSLVLRTDPRTVLPTDGVVEGLSPAMCKPFWDNELLEEDFNKFVQLARGEVAATLRSATGGDLSRSRRYRSLYQERGITDELRVSFTTRDGCCWGIAQIVRTGGAVFTAAERDLVAGAAGPIASALRARFLAAPPVRPAHGGPALVMLDNAGEIISITAEAREWLAELAKESATGMTPVPEPVYVVARLARAVRTGVGAEPASVLVQTATRGWLQLHASYLEGPESLAGAETLAGPGSLAGAETLAGPGSLAGPDWVGGPDGPGTATVDGLAGATGPVAVLLTPARAPDLMPLLALGYRLTHRECEVLQLLARGLTTAEMTGYLGISAHTVRDHIKSLFSKVGVRSRAELVARVFADHYFDRFEATLHRVGDGSAAS